MTHANTDEATTNLSEEPSEEQAPKSAGALSPELVSQRSVREELQRAIDELPEDTVTLGDLLDRFGKSGLLMLTAMMTLVFLIPVSIPGVSTVFGAGILMIGVSRALNRPIWLPKRVMNRPLSVEKLRPGLERGLKWTRRLERISRAGRLTRLVDGRAATLSGDLALILGAVLLMMPFGLIPFSNTLPGIALLFLATGMMQRDGGAVLLGHAMNIATIVYFSVLIGGAGWSIRALFGSG
ncbi:MAG: exopolysaccharide biosynthesis protein [Polyangiaceae bacterium]|nr:exopolysaccharide biosynthesis protein [Polyangiaceae bacterium]MCW5791149.1 exopolysaccharide biosynthesis protein [Polyangiaceae bacterium]